MTGKDGRQRAVAGGRLVLILRGVATEVLAGVVERCRPLAPLAPGACG